MRLIDADALKEKFKEHYDLYKNSYENEQDMSLAGKVRVDEIINSIAEIVNAPTIFDTNNATNGDVIKVMFDVTEEHFYDKDRMVDVYGLDRKDDPITFYTDWWNSLYK